MLDSLIAAWQTKSLIALSVGALGFLFGPIEAFTVALAVLICIDFFTGVWKAIKKGDFSSNGLRAGIKKLITYGLLLIVGHQLSLIGFLFWIKEAMVGYLALTEYESISENLKQTSGIHLPSLRNLKRMFESMRMHDGS